MNKQIDITPEIKNDIDKVVGSLSKEKLESAMSYSYGTDGDDVFIALKIDPTGKNDWIRAKDEIIYRAPKEYQNSLGRYAINLLRDKKEELLNKKVDVKPDVDPEKIFSLLKQNLRRHDWYYNFSDDQSYWKAGNETWKIILNTLKKAASVDPVKTKEIFKSEAPKMFHSVADNIIK